MAGSRDDIRRLFQHRPIAVDHFAYPFGDRSPAADAAVIAAGYRCSWSVEPVPVQPSDAPYFGRVTVDPHDWTLEHHLKLIGAYRWMGWLMASRRRRQVRR